MSAEKQLPEAEKGFNKQPTEIEEVIETDPISYDLGRVKDANFAQGEGDEMGPAEAEQAIRAARELINRADSTPKLRSKVSPDVRKIADKSPDDTAEEIITTTLAINKYKQTKIPLWKKILGLNEVDPSLEEKKNWYKLNGIHWKKLRRQIEWKRRDEE